MWKCPNCETVNSTEKCMVCGREKPKYSANTPKVDEKAFCGNCGAVIDGEMEFCGKCGAVVNESDISNIKYSFCGNCGEKIPDYMQICPKCGQKCFTDTEDTDSKTDWKKIFIIILSIALIIAVAVAGILLYNNSGRNNNTKDTQNNTPQVTENTDMTSPEPTSSVAASDRDINDKATDGSNNDLVCIFVKSVNTALNVRSLPQHESALVGKIDSDTKNMYYYGDIQKGYGSDNKEHNWYYIETDDGIKGYVRSDFVVLKDSVKNNLNHAFTSAEASSVRKAMKDRAGNTVYYDANNVLDGDYNTCWAMDLSTGIEPSITIFLGSKQIISGLKFSNGYFKSKEVYEKNRKITKIQVVYDGGSMIYDCDSDGYQIMQNVKFSNVVESDFITINILNSTSAECDDICISEIEVY